MTKCVFFEKTELLYFLEIVEGTIAYVYFKTESGDVKEFVVKLLCEFEGKWHEILRYDSGHECPHKDILNIDGEVIRNTHEPSAHKER